MIAPKLSTRAFTLIELLVVIVVIGILMSILLPTLSSVTQRGRITACRSEIQQLLTALSLYESDFQDYPPSSVAALGLSTDNGINSGNEALVLALSCEGKYFDFGRGQENKLQNTDHDTSPVPLVELTHSNFQTRELLERVDPWGRPYIYFHTMELTPGSQQTYILQQQAVKVTPALGSTKTGNVPGYGQFQLWSCGPDGQSASGGGDDVCSWH